MMISQDDRTVASGEEFSAAFQEAAGGMGRDRSEPETEDGTDDAGNACQAAGKTAASEDARVAAAFPDEANESLSEPDYKALYEREAQRLRSLEGRRRKEREDWSRQEREYRERLRELEDGGVAVLADAPAWAEVPADRAPDRMADAAPDLAPDQASRRSDAAPAPYRLARQAVEEAVRPVLDALERERHAAAIASAHPDWRDVAQDPELARFIDAQPGYLAEAMRRVVEYGDADEVIDFLAHFKSCRQRDQADRREADRQGRRVRLVQAAEAVPTRPAGPPRGRPDKADFSAAWTEAARSRPRR